MDEQASKTNISTAARVLASLSFGGVGMVGGHACARTVMRLVSGDVHPGIPPWGDSSALPATLLVAMIVGATASVAGFAWVSSDAKVAGRWLARLSVAAAALIVTQGLLAP